MNVNKLRVRLRYWHQFAWFYIWKWSMPWPWLHRCTIRGVNEARFAYLESYRRHWPTPAPPADTDGREIRRTGGDERTSALRAAEGTE